MNRQKRIAAIHDISGFGKCSLTVALPILSASGTEACALPTAVLSTHTGGLSGYTYRDLTEDLLPFARHWKSLGLHFDCLLYTSGLRQKRGGLLSLYRLRQPGGDRGGGGQNPSALPVKRTCARTEKTARKKKERHISSAKRFEDSAVVLEDQRKNRQGRKPCLFLHITCQGFSRTFVPHPAAARRRCGRPENHLWRIIKSCYYIR